MKTISFTIVLFLTVNLKSQDLQINEVVSKNYNGLESFENKTEDWIEIFNNSSDTIQLVNYYLSDDESNLQAWNFPNIKLAPDSFLVVFASGKNIFFPEIHTNFKLNSDGEKIYLSINVVIDSLTIPNLKADYSYGRINENSATWKLLDIPSPNYSNVYSNSLLFSSNSGFYENEFQLKINALRKNHTIYYTLNGNVPNEQSNVFKDSLLIEDRTYLENNISTIKTSPDEEIYYHNWQEPEPNIEKINSLKFVSYYQQKATSKVQTLNFLIKSPNANLKTLCITIDSLDLFSDAVGIYVPGNAYNPNAVNSSGNYFTKRKVKVHFSLFDKNGVEILNENAKTRIMGNATTAAAQKSLKFYAKKETGVNEFLAPILENDFENYEHFVVRSTQGSSLRNMLSDDLAMLMIKNLDVDFSKTEYCNVFLNGSYWGVQSLRNDLNVSFLKKKFQLENETIHIIDFNYEIVAGDNSSFLAMLKFIENNDLSINENFKKVIEELDISNYIDYQIAEMFMNNFDWPGNNAKLWKSSKADSKWRFLFYDLDGAFIDREKNMLEYCTAENSEEWQNIPRHTFLLRNLFKNKAFENQFISRYMELLNNEFFRENTIQSVNELINILAPEIEQNFARWQYPKNRTEWLDDVNTKLISFLRERPCIVQRQLNEFFDLDLAESHCKLSSKSKLNLELFPNPNKGTFNIKLDMDFQYPIVEVFIYNAQGIQVLKNTVYLQNNNSYSFENLKLSNGLYFIKVFNKNKQFGRAKFIIEN